MSDNKLQVIPLGGLGEFGMNMCVLRYGDDMIVVDAGLLFPGTELLGVDAVVPDISYLIKNKEHIRGLILTHGHEDHIGAVAYVLSELDLPIYCRPYTRALVERRLKEHDVKKPKFHELELRKIVELGPFKVDPIQVTHSVVHCVALAIETPLGVVIHTGDFKIDQSPIDNRLFDLHAFADYGQRGVLLLLSDSTNSDRPGFTQSERRVRPALDDILTRAENAVYFATFSSATHRVQQIIDVAAQHGRKIALCGRSMITNTELAQKLDLMTIPERAKAPQNELAKVPREKRCGIISGSQGEPFSALSRASVGKNRHVKIEEGDTVVLSSKIIPGNEKPIYRMVDHLYRRGADVLYGSQTPPLHVSGHASQEELQLILNLVRPKYFLPVHGEYRQLSRHAQLAHHLYDSGLKDVFVFESGDILEIDERGARKAGTVKVGRVCIDAGTGDEIIEDLVIRDRRHISESGVIVPIVALNQHTGEVESGPEIITRGFAPGEDDDLLDGAAQVVIDSIESSSAEEKTDYGVMEEKIRKDLRKFIVRETQGRPLILPVIMET